MEGLVDLSGSCNLHSFPSKRRGDAKQDYICRSKAINPEFLRYTKRNTKITCDSTPLPSSRPARYAHRSSPSNPTLLAAVRLSPCCVATHTAPLPYHWHSDCVHSLSSILLRYSPAYRCGAPFSDHSQLPLSTLTDAGPWSCVLGSEREESVTAVPCYSLSLKRKRSQTKRTDRQKEAALNARTCTPPAPTAAQKAAAVYAAVPGSAHATGRGG